MMSAVEFFDLFLSERPVICSHKVELSVGREENLCKSGQPLNTPFVDCGKQLFR